MLGLGPAKRVELGVDHQLRCYIAALDMAARRHMAQAREHLHHPRQCGRLGVGVDGKAVGRGHGTGSVTGEPKSGEPDLRTRPGG